VKAVIDSNIIFSAIISGKQFYIDIMQSNELYTPDIIFIELEKYETRIIEKSQLPIEDFRKFVKMLFEKIVVIPKMAISKGNWQKAYNLCKDLDIAFVELKASVQSWLGHAKHVDSCGLSWSILVK
jgi:predicted nucleic acid-binding protein